MCCHKRCGRMYCWMVLSWPCRLWTWRLGLYTRASRTCVPLCYTMLVRRRYTCIVLLGPFTLRHLIPTVVCVWVGSDGVDRWYDCFGGLSGTWHRDWYYRALITYQVEDTFCCACNAVANPADMVGYDIPRGMEIVTVACDWPVGATVDL